MEDIACLTLLECEVMATSIALDCTLDAPNER
jgi:hypothetical protein